MLARKKPISPHLQIYKPQITSITSILHRITGAALYLGVIILCWAIFYYAYNTDMSNETDLVECDCIWLNALRYGIYGLIILLAFSFYYHFCNGIRHLFWDIGKGFEVKTAKITGILVLSSAIAMTILSVFLVLYSKMI